MFRVRGSRSGQKSGQILSGELQGGLCPKEIPGPVRKLFLFFRKAVARPDSGLHPGAQAVQGLQGRRDEGQDSLLRGFGQKPVIKRRGERVKVNPLQPGGLGQPGGFAHNALQAARHAGPQGLFAQTIFFPVQKGQHGVKGLGRAPRAEAGRESETGQPLLPVLARFVQGDPGRFPKLSGSGEALFGARAVVRTLLQDGLKPAPFLFLFLMPPPGGQGLVQGRKGLPQGGVLVPGRAGGRRMRPLGSGKSARSGRAGVGLLQKGGEKRNAAGFTQTAGNAPQSQGHGFFRLQGHGGAGPGRGDTVKNSGRRLRPHAGRKLHGRHVLLPGVQGRGKGFGRRNLFFGRAREPFLGRGLGLPRAEQLLPVAFQQGQLLGLGFQQAQGPLDVGLARLAGRGGAQPWRRLGRQSGQSLDQDPPPRFGQRKGIAQGGFVRLIGFAPGRADAAEQAGGKSERGQPRPGVKKESRVSHDHRADAAQTGQKEQGAGKRKRIVRPSGQTFCAAGPEGFFPLAHGSARRFIIPAGRGQLYGQAFDPPEQAVAGFQSEAIGQIAVLGATLFLNRRFFPGQDGRFLGLAQHAFGLGMPGPRLGDGGAVPGQTLAGAQGTVKALTIGRGPGGIDIAQGAGRFRPGPGRPLAQAVQFGQGRAGLGTIGHDGFRNLFFRQGMIRRKTVPQRLAGGFLLARAVGKLFGEAVFFLFRPDQGRFFFRQNPAVTQHCFLAEDRGVGGGDAFRVPAGAKAGQGPLLKQGQAGAFLNKDGEVSGLVPAVGLLFAQALHGRMQSGQAA